MVEDIRFLIFYFDGLEFGARHFICDVLKRVSIIYIYKLFLHPKGIFFKKFSECGGSHV